MVNKLGQQPHMEKLPGRGSIDVPEGVQEGRIFSLGNEKEMLKHKSTIQSQTIEKAFVKDTVTLMLSALENWKLMPKTKRDEALKLSEEDRGEEIKANFLIAVISIREAFPNLDMLMTTIKKFLNN